MTLTNDPTPVFLFAPFSCIVICATSSIMSGLSATTVSLTNHTYHPALYTALPATLCYHRLATHTPLVSYRLLSA